jgi:UDP-glucose 4-epimerase
VRRAKGGGVSAYRDRRALVLGGLGFIGAHVADRLQRLGADVTVATRSLADHHDAAVAFRARNIRVVEGDLRDADAMRAAVASRSYIFNLAGQSGAVSSMEDPFTDLDVNCRGNLVLLEALREVNHDAKLVFVSSRLAYGHAGAAPAAEDRDVDPLCMHAVHKLAVEQYLRIYERAHGLRFAVARLTNPYGPGQPRARTAYGIVNRLIHLALAGEDLTVYGDGEQRRDYIYVEDAVDALLRMGESPASDGRLYNVGSGVGTRFVDMARAVSQIAGGGRVRLTPWPTLAAQIETGDFVADIDRIHRELGWTPQVALADGLQRTVAFYRAHVA